MTSSPVTSSPSTPAFRPVAVPAVAAAAALVRAPARVPAPAPVPLERFEEGAEPAPAPRRAA